MRFAIQLAVALLLLFAGGPALAQTPPATVRDPWTTEAPNASAGRDYSVEFVNPSDPSAKPPAFRHVHLQLPGGARFDTDAIPQCHASDAELTAEGPGACPADTRLGTNSATFDTGIDPMRFLHEDVTFFNAHDDLVILSQDEATGARVVLHGAVTPGALDIDLPPLPGAPPDGAAEKSEHAQFVARSTPRGNYLTTPPACPATRVWTEHVTFTFSDGTTYSTPYDNPCRPRTRAHHHRRHPPRP